MKILVTGAQGFIGKNLIAELHNRGGYEICAYGRDTHDELLELYCAECDMVFNLAGVNRPENQSEFMEGNFEFASRLLDTLERHNNTCPVMLASSVQAVFGNPYGVSKKEGEDLFFRYSQRTGAAVYIYRFPNVFGKWCRPNYNSVVATFCYKIARDLTIKVNNPETLMTFVYIDDVVSELIRAIEETPFIGKEGFCQVPVSHTVKLGEVADMIYEFRRKRENLEIPDMTEGSFAKKLYSTYLSYLPEADFSQPLKMNIDERGSFTELLRTPERGQFSVNIIKPGITKGNHWHHTKTEKFFVVSGKGLIRFRKIGSDEVIDYHVSGAQIEALDIPTGYTHSITNEGKGDLVTFMWSNECFDPNKPDTHYLKVEEKK